MLIWNFANTWTASSSRWSGLDFLLKFSFATLRKMAKQIVLTIFAGVSARKRWSSDCLRDFRYIWIFHPPNSSFSQDFKCTTAFAEIVVIKRLSYQTALSAKGWSRRLIQLCLFVLTNYCPGGGHHFPLCVVSQVWVKLRPCEAAAQLVEKPHSSGI